jgi:tRNA(Ile)-lysidine synthase
VSAADLPQPVSVTEAKTLFADLSAEPALIIAVSGGPDSMALLALAARWRAGLKRGPTLVAVTIDHGLRPESAREANAVKRQARDLGVAHRTLRWTGAKPRTGLQEAAREARYRLLSAEAMRAGAAKVLTAHTLDDQAETILLRLARGSGLSGLAAMARESDMFHTCVVRPLLDLPKVRLIATLGQLGIVYADDPSNRDPRFTRSRLRGLMPALAAEGLTAERLALLARRVRRSETALQAAVSQAADLLAWSPAADGRQIEFGSAEFRALPEEVALRLLARAIAQVGEGGPVELGKLERLLAELQSGAGPAPIRRTLAGAVVALNAKRLVVERAPPRRGGAKGRISALTTAKADKSKGAPPRLG